MSAAQTRATAAVKTVLDDDIPQVTRSYSEALVKAADAEGDIAGVLDELDAVNSEVMAAHPDFARLLVSPLVSEADKDGILVRTFEGRARPIVVRFLRVLNRRGRMGSLTPITRAARALWDRRENRRPVSVRTARPLGEDQQNALRDRLARMLSATPIVTLQVDPALIGGVVVQVGDDVFDASIRNRLEQIRQRLIEGKTHEIQVGRDRFSYST